MENKNQPDLEEKNIPENQDKTTRIDNIDDFLLPAEDEIGPDQQAVDAAGLGNISDAELEQIMKEAMAEETPAEAPEQTPEEPFRDEEYRDAFGDEDSVFSDSPKEEETVAAKSDDTPPRKGRPKRKKGAGLLGIPHLLATAVWLVIVVAIGVSLGRMIWVSVSDVLAFGREDQEVTITITDSDTIESIAEKLAQGGLIRYPGLFEMYADLSHAEEKISTGTFTLNTLYDYHALVNSMRTYSSNRSEVEVMIPEGYTSSQIFALLEEKGVCSVADLEECAANGELEEYWFLEDVERGTPNCLEGFLFPDTYIFYSDDDADRVLEKMLNDFDYRFGEKLHEGFTVLNERLAQIMANNGHDEAYIAENQITIRELIIIASLIEKETANNRESYMISSVIYNRLYDWEGYPAFLNIDAALIYALGGNIDPETGKTKPLTNKDLAMESPYNTYLHTGLPIGPISNPGLNSIYAALDPDDSNYYYYALDPDTGEHHFSSTEAEHNAFLASLGE